LYARAIVGWSVDTNMHTTLLLGAFNQMRHKRTTLHGAIFHSDRGSQYASDMFRGELSNSGMIQSMSNKGNCYDNAVAESFFHTLKTECLYHIKLNSKEEAKRVIANYINFYNRTRLHSSNGYLPPMEKEMLWWQSQIRDAA
jgi:transposase InsO family protein